jgi:hypothetical protein
MMQITKTKFRHFGTDLQFNTRLNYPIGHLGVKRTGNYDTWISSTEFLAASNILTSDLRYQE